MLLPVPTARGKGVLVAPTVFGNVLLGPTAEDVDDRTATGVHRGRAWRRCASTAGGSCPRCSTRRSPRSTPGCARRPSTTTTGSRCLAEQRYVCVGGIRSTGLTASMAIAEHVVELLARPGSRSGPRHGEPGRRRCRTLGEAAARPYQRADLVAADPAYGALVCHCERVSRGEIRDALASPVPAAHARRAAPPDARD